MDMIDDNGALVEILAVVLSLSMPPAIVWIIMAYFLKIVRTRAHMIEECMRSGVKLPPEVISKLLSTRPSITPSLIWIAIGISLCTLFVSVGASEVIAIGLLALLIGVAKLISYFVDRHDAKLAAFTEDVDSTPEKEC